MKRSLILLLLAWPLLACPSSGQALDKYGGRTDLSCKNKFSGWASMTTIGDHHFVCDPMGHPQWWVGVYVLANNFSSTTDRNGTSYTAHLEKKYGDADVLWSDAQLNRIAAWGFNGVATYGNIFVQPFYKNKTYRGSGLHTKQIPTAPNVRPGIYAISDDDSDLPCVAGDSSDCDPPKNIINAYSPFAQAKGWRAWANGSQLSDWYDARSYQWEKGELAGTGNGQSSIFGHYGGLQANRDQLVWVYAVLLDDSDQLPDASCSPQYACINPPNEIGPSKGMLTLTASPVMTANNKGVKALHFDPLVYEKRHIVQSLINKYGNIGALNAVWRSHYTAFNSSGTCIGPSYKTSPAICDVAMPSSEAHGKGNDSAGPFQFALNNSRASQLSVLIKFNGTPVAGDTPGPSNAFGTVDGLIWGPNVGGTINYLTGTISIMARAGTHPIWKVTGNGHGTISWYCDGQECGVWPGQIVRIGGTTNYNATCTVLSSPSPTAYTASCGQAGNQHTSAESGTLDPSAVVSNTVSISVDYIQNGWGIGTGVADEDGRGSHIWIGKDFQMQSGQTDALKADEDQYIEDVYAHYLEQGCAQIHAVYGDHMMCWGPDSLYRKGVISRYPILKAVKVANAAGDLDAVVSQGFYGDTSENARMLADLETYQGDVPIISGEFWTANPDSYFAAPITMTNCSWRKVTVSVPTTTLSTGVGQSGNNPSIGCLSGSCDGHVLTQGMANPTYNTLAGSPAKVIESSPTSVTYGPVSCGSNGPGGTIGLEDYYGNQPNNFPTQSARAAAYRAKVYEYLHEDRYPLSGIFAVAGIEFWGHQDNIPEGLNWGWVTPADNAYDGVEAVAASGAPCDSKSNIGHKCGGELMDLGNFIAGPNGAAATNKLWLGLAP